jgi:DNA-binding MarR family transcriptional regulator
VSPPTEDDVQALIDALSALDAGTYGLRRHPKEGTLLDLLRVIADHDGIGLSSIADRLHTHASVVGRRVRDCEDAGYVVVSHDPDDGRSFLVTLEPPGADELRRLTDVSIRRFRRLVDDWESEEVRRLTELLAKLRTSGDEVAGRPRRRRRVVRSAGEPDWLIDFLHH